MTPLSGREQTLAELSFAFAPPRHVIRDSVWGDIPLGARELALVDTAPFQRLRRIQQLGFLSWVFPGGNHTRFEHSLGVYHLTRQALIQLLRQPEGARLESRDAAAVLAASLLHDIGHYPFSHSTEELEHEVIRHHEAIGRDLITGPEIAPALVNQWGVDPHTVADMLRPRPGEPSRLHHLVAGALDADKLDYLVRDSQQCNVPYGLVDVDRLLGALCLWWPADRAQPGLAIDEGAVGALEGLVFAKYLMFSNVYWHHTGRIATAMFVRALYEALVGELVGARELEASDDLSLLRLLEERCPPDTLAGSLLRRLLSRDLFKRAVVLSWSHPAFERLAALKRRPAALRDLEHRWSERLSRITGLSIPVGAILLDVPEEKTFTAPFSVICDLPPPGYANPVPWSAVSGLGEDDLARYQRRARRVMILAETAELAAVARTYQHDLLTF
ncbi:MAG: HD domain-containing protein [Chloroflexi bacterium]|nr:HD domain-containing protein [Chloroflexota bacterium]